MIVNIYNKSGFSITSDNIVIEQGHNFIPFEDWERISKDASIISLIENCGLLVNNWQEYCSYKEALQFFTDILPANLELWESEAVDKKTFERIAQDFEANRIILDIFTEEFRNDIETKTARINLDFENLESALYTFAPADTITPEVTEAEIPAEAEAEADNTETTPDSTSASTSAKKRK